MTFPDTAWASTHTLSMVYLTLPSLYAKALGGLRWSDRDDCLGFGEGKLLTNEDIAQFLEGFASKRSLLPFGSMLHWALLLKIETADPKFNRLCGIFHTTGENWRNAGALAGMMSEALPGAADPPQAAMICTRLRDHSFPIRWFTGVFNGSSNTGEEPVHTLIEFEQHVRGGLLSLTDSDLSQWLKFGRGPLVRPGQELAGVEPPPRVVGSVFDELFNRPRLAGAAVYVPQMVLALSVPPRRQSPEQLPIGGYADIVTHGSVDRLLPSQHALDDLEFLRRFCQNELLYFRREVPPASCRQEVVVILDQGVRTWGDVRLVLSAAAFALVKHADRKSMVHYLAFTSRPKVFDNPLKEENEELGESLEASDFSPHPGLALERVLEWPSTVPRDIFLLTHPFSLMEVDVQNAARRLLAPDRLFALTVKAQGDAEFVEVRHGLPVRMKSFHVDFVQATVPAAELSVSTSTWSGSVEAVGWPFRFGPDGPIRLFGFDYSGFRLLAVTQNGMIWSWNLNDGEMEILPRPQTLRGQLTIWHALEGVTGGFALLGSQDSQYVVCHYDMLKRKCTVHKTSLMSTKDIGLAYVFYVRSVVLYQQTSEMPLLAIDLETGGISRSAHQDEAGTPRYVVNVGMEPQEVPEGSNQNRRAEKAIRYFEQVGAKSGQVFPSRDPKTLGERSPLNQPRLVLSEKTRAYYSYCSNGELTILDRGHRWQPVVLITDGKKTLANFCLQNIYLVEGTLAVQHYIPFHGPHGYKHVLGLFRGPEGHFLREISWNSPTKEPSLFRLSSDGKKLGLLRGDRHLEVLNTERPERILFTRPGGYGTVSKLWVGTDGILLCCGRKGFVWHLLHWSKDCLEIFSEMSRSSHNLWHPDFNEARIRDFVDTEHLQEATKEGDTLLNDPERWPRGLEYNGALFMLDRFGQVLVFDAARNLVFQFFAHGDSWSAWLPEGTRHGVGTVHHWPNTPGALEAMGRALKRATGGHRP